MIAPSATARPRHPVLVLGVGNLLMGDDGLGVCAVQAMQNAPRDPSIALLDAGTAMFAAAIEVERADRLIILDAIRTGRRPGTLILLDGTRLGQPAGAPRSLHEYGVAHLLAGCDPARRPGQITVLGLEPAALGFGLGLSDPVREALPELIEAAWAAALGHPLPVPDAAPFTAPSPELTP